MTDVYTPPPPPPPPPSGYDVLRPFVFMFDDPRWLPKIVVGGLFTLLSMVVAGIPFLLGYAARMTRNIIARDPRPLPEWNDLGEFFGEGLVLFAVALIYMLPVSVLSILISIPAAIVDAVNEPAIHDIGTGFVACASCVLWALSLLIGSLLPAALMMVIVTRRFGAAFEFPRMAQFLTRNLGNYVIALVIELIAYVFSFAGFALLCAGVIFTWFWGVLVTTFAFASTWRDAPQT